MSTSPSRAVADALSSDDAPITPLGSVRLGKNGSTNLVLTVPAETARGLGLDQGDEFHVGYLASEGAFVYIPADGFDGW